MKASFCGTRAPAERSEAGKKIFGLFFGAKQYVSVKGDTEYWAGLKIIGWSDKGKDRGQSKRSEEAKEVCVLNGRKNGTIKTE